MIAKGPAVILLGLGIGTAANLINHNAYWNYTIFNVQSVDFNILANVLPASIKEPLLKGNQAELRRLLDSNYSLFGIVVSRCEAGIACKSERFIASSGFHIQDNGDSIRLSGNKPWSIRATRAWTGVLKEKASSRTSFVKHLKENKSVDVQGIYAESTKPDFAYERVNNRREATRLNHNEGIERIGNIYFIRNTVPPFTDELANSLSRLFKTGSTTLPAFLSTRQGVIFQTYIGSVVVVLFLWTVFELIAARYKYEQQIIAAKYKYEQQKEWVKLQEQKLKFFRVRFAADHFSNAIDGFAHNLRNAGQQVVVIMNELVLRTQADMCSIVHDINKAPLIGSSDEQFDELIQLLKNSKHPADKESADIIQKLKATRDQLGFVVSDMRSASNTSTSSIISITSLLERLKSRLPPIGHNDQLELTICNLTSNAAIAGNEWQIFCILRNIYYNSSAASIKKRANMRKNDRLNFTPKFKLTARVIENYVEFVIEDNGPGIPAEKLGSLYQWSPSTAENLGADRLSGYGSDIVGTYLMLNNASVSVSNLIADDNSVCGSRVTLRFKSVHLAP